MHGRVSNASLFRQMTFSQDASSEMQHLDVVSRFRLRRVSNVHQTNLQAKKHQSYMPVTLIKPSSPLYRMWQLVRSKCICIVAIHLMSIAIR